MSDNAAFLTPDWVRDAVFYQIFPDRFANGNTANDPSNVEPWGSPPTLYNHMGGDLDGITNQLDYLVDLGVNALYLTPIFQSPTNHKYHTIDYYRIDPFFGDQAAFKGLMDAARARGVRIILDAVFNHCGRGFYAFNDVLENGYLSPYKDWFYIYNYPVNAYNEYEPANYATWWNIRALPKFNVQNPATRKYLLEVGRYWVEEMGIDGWRLDVPNEVEISFWTEFRQIIKAANPEAYIVGEIWGDGSPWLQGDKFDAIMNYSMRAACLAYFGKLSYDASLDHMSWDTRHDPLFNNSGTNNLSSTFTNRIAGILQRYSPQATYTQLNVLGSHDTPRLMTLMSYNIDCVKLSYLFQMTYVGAPCIYYGDEIGLQGNGDPDSRRTFPWNSYEWNTDLRNHIKNLIALRHAHPSLRRGDFTVLGSDDARSIVAYARRYEGEVAVVVLNNSVTPQNIQLSVEANIAQPGQSFCDVLNGGEHTVVSLFDQHSGFDLRLAARSGAILIGRLAETAAITVTGGGAAAGESPA